MSDKFSFYQTEGLWGIIENASDEKQTSIKSYFGSDLIIKRLNEQADQINQLKQQLEEKDNYHLRYELAGADETITNLKKQIEEKDKEIEKLNKTLEMCKHTERYDIGEMFLENAKLIIEKRQFAIQKLEKVEELVLKIDNNKSEIKTLKNGYSTLYVDSSEVIFIIDQQIKELKGE